MFSWSYKKIINTFGLQKKHLIKSYDHPNQDGKMISVSNSDFDEYPCITCFQDKKKKKKKGNFFSWLPHSGLSSHLVIRLFTHILGLSN